MGRKSKTKGKTGEREVATIFRARLHNAETALGYTHRVSAGIKRTSGMAANDGGSDLVGIPMVCVEVKRCEKLAINAWWEQARSQAIIEHGTDKSALLIYRKSRMVWQAMFYHGSEVVTWPLDTFLDDLYMPWYKSVYLPQHGVRA